MSLPMKTSISPKSKNTENDKMHNSQNMKITKNVSKKCENRGGLISALKPGPVVPPGIEKVPNQAARKTQSVKKCHLSDILAILRGGAFFDHFLCFFTFLILTFWWFLIFSLFTFYHFFCFLDFVTFYVLMVLINFCHFFLLRTYFDHFSCLN